MNHPYCEARGHRYTDFRVEDVYEADRLVVHVAHYRCKNCGKEWAKSLEQTIVQISKGVPADSVTHSGSSGKSPEAEIVAELLQMKKDLES